MPAFFVPSPCSSPPRVTARAVTRSQTANQALANARPAADGQQQQQQQQQQLGEKWVTLACGGAALACAAVGARMDWCVALLLPALSFHLREQKSDFKSVLLVLTFTALFVVSVGFACFAAMQDRARAAAALRASAHARKRSTRALSLSGSLAPFA